MAEIRVLCERDKTEPASAAPEAPSATAVIPLLPARLLTITGVSSAPEFYLERPRINLGREAEITDSLGRAVRRNQLYFSETAHEANASVSRAHAHLAFDASSNVWRIFDDGSSIGTTLFREGRRIDVPAHAGRGVALRHGDEIYLGQVRLQFETGLG